MAKSEGLDVVKPYVSGGLAKSKNPSYRMLKTVLLQEMRLRYAVVGFHQEEGKGHPWYNGLTVLKTKLS